MDPTVTQPSASIVTDARMVRTRAALRQALLALIERMPFDAITVRDLVAEADIGYATFFRHYPSKGALLDEVAADQIHRLVEMSAPALSNEGPRASSMAVCTYVDEHRALWSALLTGGAAGAMREEFSRVARQSAQHQIPTNSWLPVELGIIYGVGATVEILAWWLRQPEPLSVERIAEILDRLVMTPTVGAAWPKDRPASATASEAK
jgi:AcrR family transcriptional regulator